MPTSSSTTLAGQRDTQGTALTEFIFYFTIDNVLINKWNNYILWNILMWEKQVMGSCGLDWVVTDILSEDMAFMLSAEKAEKNQHV